MRSSVTRDYKVPPHSSQPPSPLQTRRPQLIDNHFAISRSQQSQSRLTLAPTEGWLAIVLLAIAVYSVVFSIISINQVDHSFILLASTAIGLLVGLLVAKLRHLPQIILHLGACLLGHWLSVFFTSALAFHVPWIEL